jgi:hypothetical protein
VLFTHQITTLVRLYRNFKQALSDGGKALAAFCEIVSEFIQESVDIPEMQEFVAPLQVVQDKTLTLTNVIAIRAQSDVAEVGAASTHYLRVIGHLTFAYLWARMARIALERTGSTDRFYEAKLITARFYFEKMLPEIDYHIAAARAGATPLMALDEALF